MIWHQPNTTTRSLIRARADCAPATNQGTPKSRCQKIGSDFRSRFLIQMSASL